MRLIIYEGEDRRPVADRLGAEDYVARFVVEAFMPVLERIGPVHLVRHLDDAEPVRAACEAGGESCAILSFAPPHKTTLFMRVPLIPVFTWEFDTIPCEEWDGQPKHDWRMVLQQQGRAITLSDHSAAVVRATVGGHFPVLAVAPPVFDRMTALRDRIGGRAPRPQTLTLRATIIDSRALPLSPDMPTPAMPGPAAPSAPVVAAAAVPAAAETVPPPSGAVSGWRGLVRRAMGRRPRTTALPPAPSGPIVVDEAETVTLPAALPDAVQLELAGIVYLAVLDPVVRRKNWEDILTGFTWALRDREDATLVIKIVSVRPEEYWEECFNSLRKQPRFACRVVFVAGFLDDAAMGQLLEAASYVVNASSGEGCCLPLLEGMSVGRPAIAPDHTAMSAYVDASNSFIVASHPQATRFPHDGRVARRTLWHVPRWDTLRDAFGESYRVANEDLPRWLAMAGAAIDAQRSLCADAVVEARLRRFLGVAEPATARSGTAPVRLDRVASC